PARSKGRAGAREGMGMDLGVLGERASIATRPAPARHSRDSRRPARVTGVSPAARPVHGPGAGAHSPTMAATYRACPCLGCGAAGPPSPRAGDALMSETPVPATPAD